MRKRINSREYTQKIENQPACAFRKTSEDCPLFHDLKLEILRASRAQPRITPKRMAEMLPVSIKERKPPTARKAPAPNYHF